MDKANEFSHKGFGISFSLPAELLHKDIERYEDTLLSYFSEYPDDVNSIILNQGAIVKAAAQVGWLKEIDINAPEDVAEMKPSLVKWLSTIVHPYTREFVNEEVEEDLPELPEILQKDLEFFDREKVKRKDMILSTASLHGTMVRIACELKWLPYQAVEVGGMKSSLVYKLAEKITEHVREAIEIPPE